MNSLDFPIVLALQIFIFIEINETYNFQCPSANQWYLRAVSLCNTLDKYVCLYDDNNHIWNEQCRENKSATTGTKQTFNKGNYNKMPCSNDTYQPFPFSTINSSDCVYQKYICAEEGSIPCDNGSHKTNRKCRCDYTKNYIFISKLANHCHCDPKEEDCSCYLNLCGADEKLSQDYECIQKSKEPEKQFKCETIELQLNRPKEKDNDRLLDTIGFSKVEINATKAVVCLIVMIICMSIAPSLSTYYAQIFRTLMACWQNEVCKTKGKPADTVNRKETSQNLAMTVYKQVCNTKDEPADTVIGKENSQNLTITVKNQVCDTKVEPADTVIGKENSQNLAMTVYKQDEGLDDIEDEQLYKLLLTCDQEYRRSIGPLTADQKKNLLPIMLKAYNSKSTSSLTQNTPASLERETSLTAPLTPTTPTSPERDAAEIEKIRAETELAKTQTELLKMMIERLRQTVEINRELPNHAIIKKLQEHTAVD